MADVLQQTNEKLIGAVSGITGNQVLNFFGWVLLGIIIIGGAVWGAYWWFNKKQFNKDIRIFEIINGHYLPTGSDTAKTVKLGSGGFEILYLKKRKIYRIAYGDRVGKSVYYFFIMPDGYWYNGLLTGTITKEGNVQIKTTNPLARAQYTALEKYVDNLYSEKKGFWDKYGNWVLSLGFIVIIGAFAWLIFREISPLLSNFPSILEKLDQLLDKANQLVASSCNTNNPNSGIYKVG